MGTQDMIRVDPKLFITCRLCLEEMGTYQITPAVREQFQYCFDIDVDAFDGLPQLICEICQTILCDYSTKKRIYIGRQNALKAQLQVRREIQMQQEKAQQEQAQQELVTSSHNENEIRFNGNEATDKYSKRRKRYSKAESSTSTSTVSRWSHSPSPVFRRSRSTNKNKIDHTSNCYTKSIVCRICCKQLKTMSNLKNHLSHKHKNIQSFFSNILSSPCSVKLSKFDGLPNRSGLPNTVMLDQTKIISQSGINSHYVQYVRNETDQTANDKSDTDSDEEVIGKGNQAKRLRLLSTDTVVLKNENKSPVVTPSVENTEIECINIDDSSNEGSSNEVPNNDNSADAAITDDNSGTITDDNLATMTDDNLATITDDNLATMTDDNLATITDDNHDWKALQSLVTMCYNRYVKKYDSQIKVDSAVLKHKILSIGRKVISKDSVFSFTGLLRYMESKNLEIRWLPPRKPKMDNNVVRIMTMLKEKDVTSDNKQWKKIDIPDKKINKLLHGPQENSIHAKKTLENNKSTIITQEISTSNENISPCGQETVMLNMEPDKILLNANPVANPRQMPKKSTTTGLPIISSTTTLADLLQPENINVIPTSSLAILIQQKGNVQSGPLAPDTLPATMSNINLAHSNELAGMPVITSTTSLALPVSGNGLETVNNSKEADESQQSQPRIKVKPVSQLMSDRALQSLNEHQVQNQNIMTPSAMVGLPTTNLVTLGNPVCANGVDSRIILHTVEFPNTITDSPFRYFRNLLQVHNLILLDPNTAITSAFVCLIKFKLQFLWDTVNQPVTLCLTVHCSGNTYILGVKDPKQTNNIDLNKLSAIWQWQILKIYVTRDDVVNKMLATAKKINSEIYNNTKQFLCLLKSINYRLPSEA